MNWMSTSILLESRVGHEGINRSFNRIYSCSLEQDRARLCSLEQDRNHLCSLEQDRNHLCSLEHTFYYNLARKSIVNTSHDSRVISHGELVNKLVFHEQTEIIVRLAGVQQYQPTRVRLDHLVKSVLDLRE
jgi:hypothetical protein